MTDAAPALDDAHPGAPTLPRVSTPADARLEPGEGTVLQRTADEGADHVLRAVAAHGRIELRLPLRPGERIVGGGQQYVTIAQRPRVLRGQIESALHAPPRASYFVVPLFHSSAGYSIRVDTLAAWQADIGESDPNQLVITIDADECTVRVHSGTPASALERWRNADGPAAVAPPWAFGVWVAARSGTEAVLADVDRHLALGVPVAAVWVDDYYDPATNSGDGISYPYPVGEYPSLPDLTAALHARGVRALGYLNCMIYRDTPAEKLALEQDAVLRAPDGQPHRIRFFHPQRQGGVLEDTWGIAMHDDIAAVLDVDSPAGRHLLREFVDGMLADGWDGWMQDFGEQHPDPARRNAYPLEYHRVTAEAIAAAGSDAVFFVRSGTLGSERFAPVLWGGDQSNDWSMDRGLASLVPGGISAGLSGVITWCPDIAGLVELHGRTGAHDEELWLRWMQFGALSPIMRLHLGFKARDGVRGVDVWANPRVTGIFGVYARLHEALRPALAQYAAGGANDGRPVLRALVLEFPDDPECWDLSDQYLIGDALLVAPVIEAGARERRLYLPRGAWTDLWTGHRFEGARWVTVDAPLERIPVLLRDDRASPLTPENGARWAAELTELIQENA